MTKFMPWLIWLLLTVLMILPRRWPARRKLYAFAGAGLLILPYHAMRFAVNTLFFIDIMFKLLIIIDLTFKCPDASGPTVLHRVTSISTGLDSRLIPGRKSIASEDLIMAYIRLGSTPTIPIVTIFPKGVL